jgi:hypothetical protein
MIKIKLILNIVLWKLNQIIFYLIIHKIEVIEKE